MTKISLHTSSHLHYPRCTRAYNSNSVPVRKPMLAPAPINPGSSNSFRMLPELKKVNSGHNDTHRVGFSKRRLSSFYFSTWEAQGQYGQGPIDLRIFTKSVQLPPVHPWDIKCDKMAPTNEAVRITPAAFCGHVAMACAMIYLYNNYNDYIMHMLALDDIYF